MLESWSEIDKLQPHPRLFPKPQSSHAVTRRHIEPAKELRMERSPVAVPPFKIELGKLGYHFFGLEKLTILERVLSEPPISHLSVEMAIPQIESFLKVHFKKRKTVYPSDVALSLGIDYEIVREAFERLVREDKVKVADKVAR